MAEAKAVLRFVRVAPRKARAVVDLIRGQQVPQALAVLKYTPRAAAKVVEQTVASLDALLNGLKSIEAPKTVVLVSGGFVTRNEALPWPCSAKTMTL